MDNYYKVKDKLSDFITKYYKNKLLKGTILFSAVGLLYLLLILTIEYFLWLDTSGRKLLFWLFLILEIGLLIYFIVIPLFKLFRLSGGLSEEDASRIIGDHFPEVKDKLLNLLELKKSEHKSDLLIAGINQKAKMLFPIPFNSAVNYKTSLKYLKWAAFPVIIFLTILITGNSSFLSESYGRVVNFNSEFQPPAPFYFVIVNQKLEVLENRDLTLTVKTIGEVRPEEVSISYNNQNYLLQQVEPGVFEYTFKRLKEDLNFRLSSSSISSSAYNIEVKKIPFLVNLDMRLDYPDYTGRENDSVGGTGNVRVPEGTEIKWRIKTRETQEVHFTLADTILDFDATSGIVTHRSMVFSPFKYSLSSSNSKIRHFEPVSYEIDIIRDRFPEIEVTKKSDSIDEQISYFLGNVSDDYAVEKLQLVYYPEGALDSLERVSIPIAKESFANFLFTFPGDLSLERGVNYLYFFQVFDNDAVNGSKSSRSNLFSFKKRSIREVEEEKMLKQEESIQNLGKSLKEMEYSKEELNDFFRIQKENKSLDYNQRRKLHDFLERQKKQNEMMKDYTEKLKNSLKEEKDSQKGDPYKKELNKRLEKNEGRLKENEALMEELKEFSDKINREELGKKLEELSKSNQAQQRSMEQLLELTKRYYVEERNQKLARELEEIARAQMQIFEKNKKNDIESQKKIAEKFDQFLKQMDELEKDNERLTEPVELNRNKGDEENIQKDLGEAEKNMRDNKPERAKEKQKDAAKKMFQMSAKMKEQMRAQSGEQLKANIGSLRQILDNLVRFSFQQEDLMESFKVINREDPMFADKLNLQNDLKENFRHIDDSLYSLALKNPMIGEKITEKLSDVEFDINKALERLAENELPQGTASQQYVVTGANDLAYLLSNILSSMQQQMNPQPGKGGNGEDFQLPDIIQKQKDLQQKLQEGFQKRKDNQGRDQEKGYDKEQESGDLFEIYREQYQLRQALEKLLELEDRDANGEFLRQKMLELEEQLIDKGFSPESLQRMTQLMHELMKFDKARLEQGEDDERKSETNKEKFINSSKGHHIKAKEYFNQTEILNRQILPLRENYQQKVKQYFERKKPTN
ncbi:hypothetical protein [Salegentibacter sp. F14]